MPNKRLGYIHDFIVLTKKAKQSVLICKSETIWTIETTSTDQSLELKRENANLKLALAQR